MNILGHHVLRERLKRIADREHPPQSYLFSGPEGVGKKLVAIEFALSLMGEDNLDRSGHPDLLVIGPSEERTEKGVKKKQIRGDEVRIATQFLSRYPAEAERRVVIVDEAERLSLLAENALLKILEEPEEKSALILVTHQPGKLLPTIRSRVVSFSFDILSEAELKAGFPDLSPRIVPDFFFRLGLPALLAHALEDPAGFQAHAEKLRSLFQVSKLSIRERLALAEKLAEDESALPDLLTEWLLGLHEKSNETTMVGEVQQYLFLLDRLERQSTTIVDQRGNTRLLLEKLLLPL